MLTSCVTVNDTNLSRLIYYCHDYADYLVDCRGMIYDYFETVPGPFVKEENELLASLEDVDGWYSDPDYQKRYADFVERFNTYTDGGSCERLAHHIAKMRLRPRLCTD